MQLNIREIAERQGIKNARQLQRRTGLGTQSCYQLWEGTAKMISLETLNTLGNVLQAGPGILFKWMPDATEGKG